MQQLQVPILPNADCKEKYRQIGKLNSDAQFSELAICAGYMEGGKDACLGDSGKSEPESQKSEDRLFFIISSHFPQMNTSHVQINHLYRHFLSYFHRTITSYSKIYAN